MIAIRTFALVTCLGLIPTAAAAIELTSIDRSLRKEPAYLSADPYYCLLALGQDARTLVWLVVDGNRLYVDRNANGDLTDPGECVLSERSTSFTVDELAEADGRTVHQELKLYLYDQARFRLSITLSDGCRQTVGYGNSKYVKPRLSERPEDAPIVHLNGPKTFARYGPISFLPRTASDRSYRQTWLRVMIGSPGLGEATFAGYNCKALRCPSGYRGVTADVEYANRVDGAPPVTQRDYLKVRG